MNARFIHELSLAAEAHGVYAEDFADRLSSKYTSIGLLALAAITVMRQYVFKPIQCWVPAEWPRSWEEYAENFCWTQGTYRVSMQEVGHPEVQLRGESAINYYQWVPILLLAQSLLVLAPHQLWCLASRHLSGHDPHTVVKFAHDADRAGSPESKDKLLMYAAWHVSNAMRFTAAGPGDCGGQGCSEATRRSGCSLFVVYLVSKVAYAFSAIGQVFIIKAYLGFSSPLFGWHCAWNLLNGGQWEQTGVFPRLAYCDLPLRHIGQWNLRSVQCVLALNMVFEKIFIFQWFWFTFCLLVTLVYTACWLAQLLPRSSRASTVRSHLRLLHQPELGSSRQSGGGGGGGGKVGANMTVESLVTKRLQLDGVFMLQMIADNADCLSAAQVLGKLFKLTAKAAADEAAEDEGHEVNRPLRGDFRQLLPLLPHPMAELKDTACSQRQLFWPISSV